MLRPLFLLLALLVASPALAGGLAYVDFQRAVNETEHGKKAQERLQNSFSSKRAAIDRKTQDLQSALMNYQQRQAILNEEARAGAETEIRAMQQQLQADMVRHEQEMSDEYRVVLADLDTQMRALAVKIGKERGFDLVLDQAMVVYAGPTVVDITDDLIRRYDAQ